MLKYVKILFYNLFVPEHKHPLTVQFRKEMQDLNRRLSQQMQFEDQGFTPFHSGMFPEEIKEIQNALDRGDHIDAWYDPDDEAMSDIMKGQPPSEREELFVGLLIKIIE